MFTMPPGARLRQETWITANRKLPYTSRTLANGQSVREDYGRFEECTVRLREILRFV
jgi:hypothetical protein